MERGVRGDGGADGGRVEEGALEGYAGGGGDSHVVVRCEVVD